MQFLDRRQAGQKLAEQLKEYRDNQHTIVIALPRGGVVVGYEVALALHLSLDIVCPRKIGAPFNPEFAIGAITETGEGILSDETIEQLQIPEDYIQEAVTKEKKEAIWRMERYRQGRPPRHLQDKTVILVDDGLATGSTMKAAIRTVRSENAKEIVVAVPVAPPDTLKEISREVDRVVCLTAPSTFKAVGQFYKVFDQTTDQEVITLLSKKNIG